MTKGRTPRWLAIGARGRWLLGLCMSLAAACKSPQLTSQGAEVVTVQAMPGECEELGLVTGSGGGLLGGYVDKESLIQSATEDAQEKASALGATHFVAQPAEIQHGTATAITRNQQPAMGHGDSSSATVKVTGTAYRCQPGGGGAQVIATPPSGTAMAPPVSTPPAPAAQSIPPTNAGEPGISLLPLGALRSVTVFQLIPETPRNEAEEIEVLEIDEPATLGSLADDLRSAQAVTMQFVPTHRIDFVGELGTQSLLYGFGHLKYAGRSYQLRDRKLEETLELVTHEEKPEE